MVCKCNYNNNEEVFVECLILVQEQLFCFQVADTADKINTQERYLYACLVSISLQHLDWLLDCCLRLRAGFVSDFLN